MNQKSSPLLSIVIPVYNEGRTVVQLLDKVMAISIIDDCEVIAVNDGSKDNSLQVLQDYAKSQPRMKVLNNEKNLGKSQTVRKGILATQGQYVVIQDADLEYEPNELVGLLKQAQDNTYDVVYGNRFGQTNQRIYLSYYLGNRSLSFISNLFTFPRLGKYIPDMEVCYKLIEGTIAREIAEKITATSNFGLEPEITARLAKYRKSGKRLRFHIVPISYKPRTLEEGKHIRWRDGVKALWEIIYYNLFAK